MSKHSSFQYVYEILKPIAVLSESEDMTLEANVISWNYGNPVIDIRSWSKDHEKMTHGVTLNGDELDKLIDGLKAFQEEQARAKEEQSK